MRAVYSAGVMNWSVNSTAWKRVVPVGLLLLLHALVVSSAESENSGINLEISRPNFNPAKRDSELVYWNMVTGETQDVNPGGVPFEMEDGSKYWMDPVASKVSRTDPQADDYVWTEMWSGEHRRAFYRNRETGESVWERPVDLGWRLVRRPQLDDTYAEL